MQAHFPPTIPPMAAGLATPLPTFLTARPPAHAPYTDHMALSGPPGLDRQPSLAQPAATPRGPGSFYAINGWFGDLPFIGYGMNRLQQSVTGESRAYSRHSEGRILREIIEKSQAGTLARPLVLVGHSLGGGAVTRIARELHAHGIAVDYLGVVDAPFPVEITPNVLRVDNFTSTASNLGKRLSRGAEIRLDGVSHIALGDHPAVHQRISSQTGLSMTRPAGA